MLDYQEGDSELREPENSGDIARDFGYDSELIWDGFDCAGGDN